MQSVNFTGTDLSNSNFYGADLRGVDIAQVNLTNADLRFANLENFFPGGSAREEITWTGANLYGAKLPSGYDQAWFVSQGAVFQSNSGVEDIYIYAEAVAESDDEYGFVSQGDTFKLQFKVDQSVIHDGRLFNPNIEDSSMQYYSELLANEMWESVSSNYFSLDDYSNSTPKHENYDKLVLNNEGNFFELEIKNGPENNGGLGFLWGNQFKTESLDVVVGSSSLQWDILGNPNSFIDVLVNNLRVIDVPNETSGTQRIKIRFRDESNQQKDYAFKLTHLEITSAPKDITYGNHTIRTYSTNNNLDFSLIDSSNLLAFGQSNFIKVK